jgi:hypothetical protein
LNNEPNQLLSSSFDFARLAIDELAEYFEVFFLLFVGVNKFLESQLLSVLLADACVGFLGFLLFVVEVLLVELSPPSQLGQPSARAPRGAGKPTVTANNIKIIRMRFMVSRLLQERQHDLPRLGAGVSQKQGYSTRRLERAEEC